MIRIIADAEGLSHAPPNALVAAETADYVHVRRRIHMALGRAEPLTIYANNPVVLHWLRDLRRYPENRIHWEVVDPREQFLEIFGVVPSGLFTPKQLAVLQLDKLPTPPTGSRVDPTAWILGHLLDPIWQYDEPPPNHASALVSWVIEYQQPFPPDLQGLIQAQLARWAEHDSTFAALHADSLRLDSAQLLIRWALHNYVESWRQTKPWGTLPLLPGMPSVRAVGVVLEDQQVATSIHAYWRRCMSDRSAELSVEAMLTQMSGMSMVELEVLEEIVVQRSLPLSAHTFRQIESHFDPILPKGGGILSRLKKQIAPPRPHLPEHHWSVNQWLSWVTQEYMPFYTWVVDARVDRVQQQEYALSYSDWLYSNYPNWLNDNQSPLLLSQYQEIIALLEREPNALVFWLVVDGMRWWHGEFIREACERYGLHIRALRPGVALLPSITDISKRALVTGLPTRTVDTQTVADAARMKFHRSHIPAIAGSSFRELASAIHEQASLRIALFFYNLIDTLSHQTPADSIDNAGLRGHFEDLARNLDEVHRICVQRSQPLYIFVGSDHGATLLPENATLLTLPDTAREITDVWSSEPSNRDPHWTSTRAAALAISDPQNIDRSVWYFLDRERFQLDQHYLVPRGYGYLKRRPAGWVHGGLSPEETIVPLMQLSKETLTILPIEHELRGDLRSNQAGSLTLILRNLNPFPVSDLHFVVADNLAEIRVPHIPPSQRVELAISVRAIPSQSKTFITSYDLHYQALGVPQHQRDQLTFTLRQLQTVDSSFEDMFNT